MTAQIKGWCPGALRPMQAADGWILRLRPVAGTISAEQTGLLIAALDRYGIAQLALSNRANLQLRGVQTADLSALQGDLAAAGLIDHDPDLEARRNIVTSPLRAAGDVTLELHDALLDRLRASPQLPSKFGFALDTGAAACLANAPADLRIELSDHGLILRPDGARYGELQPSVAALMERLAELLRWFCAQDGARRMRDLRGQLHHSGLQLTIPPRPQPPLPQDGSLLYAPFGEISAAAFTALRGHELRLTPWRAIRILPAIAPPDGWISDASDPILQIEACPGAPQCGQSSVQTRALARRLAPHLKGKHLHISGCAKGCAAPQALPTLIGRQGRFDFVRHGKASDAPDLSDLHPADITDLIIRGEVASHL